MTTDYERSRIENAEYERRAQAEAEFYARRDEHERKFPDQWGLFGKGTIAAALVLVVVAGTFMFLASLLAAGASLVLDSVAWISDLFGVSQRTGAWLLGLAVIAAAGALLRARRARIQRRRTSQAAVLGFRSLSDYELAAAQRVRRLGRRRYRKLVKEMLRVNRESTGRRSIPDLVEFERALTWTGARRGIDASLRPK